MKNRLVALNILRMFFSNLHAGFGRVVVERKMSTRSKNFYNSLTREIPCFFKSSTLD